MLSKKRSAHSIVSIINKYAFLSYNTLFKDRKGRYNINISEAEKPHESSINNYKSNPISARKDDVFTSSCMLFYLVENTDTTQLKKFTYFNDPRIIGNNPSIISTCLPTPTTHASYTKKVHRRLSSSIYSKHNCSMDSSVVDSKRDSIVIDKTDVSIPNIQINICQKHISIPKIKPTKQDKMIDCFYKFKRKVSQLYDFIPKNSCANCDKLNKIIESQKQLIDELTAENVRLQRHLKPKQNK